MREAEWERRGELLGVSPAELKAQRERLFTISNGISLLRILALPFLLQALALPYEEGLVRTIFLAIFIAATDVLDGFAARRLGQVSELGKVIDPLADKICVGTVSIWLYLYRGLPLWIVLLVIGRDVLIVLGGIILARRTRIVIPSNWLGRLTTLTLALTLFAYIVGWTWPQRLLVDASAVLVIASLIAYMRIGWHIVRRL